MTSLRKKRRKSLENFGQLNSMIFWKDGETSSDGEFEQHQKEASHTSRPKSPWSLVLSPLKVFFQMLHYQLIFFHLILEAKRGNIRPCAIVKSTVCLDKGTQESSHGHWSCKIEIRSYERRPRGISGRLFNDNLMRSLYHPFQP